MKTFTLSILLTGLTSLANARTVLNGCVSSETVNQWGHASMIWYVPDTREICDFPDCGGGRAPPKYTQPGCPLYTGTETLTPSYLPGWGPNGKIAPSTTAATATATGSQTSATATNASTSGSNTDSGSTLITAAPTFSRSASSSSAGSSSGAPASSSAASSASSSGASNTTSAIGVTPTGNAATGLGINVAGVLAFAGLVGVVAL
ncbi:hypothetical protein BDV29DRAFT_178764 [Aspergillus leporis]|uniref:Siderophore biosynthesis enzyme n=1 Tax=Aspergillus leporis TaxID=41062 RepID=A0A5N5WT73_9EURO|nr:hypothetical protein BDV29DRAFT_178764 [Aspergillus leporis]